MALVIAVAGGGFFLSGLLVGYRFGQRGVWRGLMTDRQARERALTRLADVHGAKLEIREAG